MTYIEQTGLGAEALQRLGGGTKVSSAVKRPPRTQDTREKLIQFGTPPGMQPVAYDPNHPAGRSQPGVTMIKPTTQTDPSKYGLPTSGGYTQGGTVLSHDPAGVNRPVTDPNSLDRTITPENTLRNQRLGFGVSAPQISLPSSGGGVGNVSAERISARDTVGSIKEAFQAQLPQMMQQFRDQVEGLTSRTAAMGRTGSGMFNEETGFIGDRAIAAREGLLGNLAFTATQNDANRALQAAQANQGASLQAGLGNQSAGLQSRSLDANIAQANAARQLQVDLARQSHLGQLQAREDALARQAMQDRQFQMQMLNSAFGGAPTGAVGQAVQAGLSGVNNFGANAGQLNAQLMNAGMQQGMNTPQGGGSSIGDAIGSIAGLFGGGDPLTQAPPLINRQPTGITPPPINLPGNIRPLLS